MVSNVTGTQASGQSRRGNDDDKKSDDESDVNADVQNSKNWLHEQNAQGEVPTSENANDKTGGNDHEISTVDIDDHSSASGSADIEYNGYGSVDSVTASHGRTSAPEESTGTSFLFAILDVLSEACKMTGTLNRSFRRAIVRFTPQ